MKVAYFDCIAGVSGDMILGALVDSGISPQELRQRLGALRLDDEFEIQARQVVKNGLRATKVDVILKEHSDQTRSPAGRHLEEIRALLAGSALPKTIREQAGQMLQRLAEVEAEIHATSPHEIHFHEAGGTDAIVDIVGALLGLEMLGIQQVMASPLPLGRGFIRSAHGNLPLPAPATLALLKDVPVYGLDIEAELVTPTGALILTNLCHTFGPLPPMRLQTIGYGAGARELPIPNLLRLLVGEQENGLEHLLLLETNLDDSSPEILGYVMERLLSSGALDAFFTPIQMKKNRPAVMLSVLCRPQDAADLESILFQETSTLGIRRRQVERRALERFSREVETPYGTIRVKIARLPNGDRKLAPEYEDCKRAAEAHRVPLRMVYEAVCKAVQ